MDRAQIIGELEEKYKLFTDALFAELENHEFIFEEQKTAHLAKLDRKLITRHALPYCATEDAFFRLDNGSVKFFAAVILLHTLALTRVDDYYDGGDRTKTVRPLNVQSLAYSLSATHEAIGTLLQKSPDVRELVKLLNVTNFVHARMYKDYTERYNIEFLENPSSRLASYINSPKSRLLGSGYWEVMARASFVQRGQIFPDYLHLVDLKLRKFRQIIDELADTAEDLRGGLVTLPIIHMLNTHPKSEFLKHKIIKYWNGGLIEDAPEIQIFLEESNTSKWVYEQAMALYEDAMDILDKRLMNRNSEYKRLFDFKRAKLESLTNHQ